MSELRKKSTITEPNEKLAYALRAKRILIDKNNSKLSDADYLFWHENTFLPMIKSISADIGKARDGATFGIPPVVLGMGFAAEKNYDKYSAERTMLESDTKYDIDIKEQNLVFR